MRKEKSVALEQRDQHSGRVRYPTIVTAGRKTNSQFFRNAQPFRAQYRGMNTIIGSFRMAVIIPLLLALAVMLLAASSAQATIMISASEVGSDVVFTLSGSVDLNSVPSSYGSQGPNNSNLLIANAGQLFFATPGSNNGLFYSLQNFSGLSNFGAGGIFIQTATNTGSIFNFYASSAVFLLDATYTSGASLANTMTFPGTFASLGMMPGTYEWSWSNNNVSDNLILNIGQSVPEGGSTLALLGLALGGVLVGARRWKPATA